MNEKIANVLKTQIEGLDFVDKIAGLTRPLLLNIMDVDNKSVPKIYPISCDITSDDCIKGRYQDLIPSSKYASIIYFEDAGGVSMQYVDKRWVTFSARLNLVCWLNLKKIGEVSTCSSSAQVLLSILAMLPEFPISDGIYQAINIRSISEAVKSNAIFSRYSYDEKLTQYLLYPYDFFMLNLAVDFRINLNCVTQFERGGTCLC
jgi:hypothetical protein